MNKIDIREVCADDLARCYVLEMVCFPDDEAAGEESIQNRIEQFPQGFLVAEEDGAVIGHVNCGCTSKPDLADEEFKQLMGHDPDGTNMVIFSLAVLEDYQGQGVGTKLMDAFVSRSRDLSKEAILLLCKPPLIPYYTRFGFTDSGPSPSTHGGAAWHEMRLGL